VVDSRTHKLADRESQATAGKKYWILPRGYHFWHEGLSEKISGPHKTDERKMNPLRK
jgi:hypothetical protein